MDRTQRNQASPTGVAALEDPPEAPGFRAISSVPRPCRLAGAVLVVAPFRIDRFGLSYRSASEIRIDLTTVAPGHYQVLAVHNFHMEDCNPCLSECVAGIFLATRRSDGSWEAPERFPVECRAVGVLGTLLVPDDAGLAELEP